MANYNCEACEDIRQNDPNLIVNGWSDSECTSMQNDTGLNPTSGHNDCTDLKNLNDCLIGNEEAELDSYEVCDWKKFMKRFIPNLWTVLEAIICAICGIWTNIHRLWDEINKLWQKINQLLQDIANLRNNITALCNAIKGINKGKNFVFSEYSTSTNSYIVAGKGISFLNVSGSGTASDVYITHIAGGMGVMNGSCLFYTSSFTDNRAVYNFDDNGDGSHLSSSRSGNSVWSNHDYKVTGGELVYEVRIKKSEYPQIDDIFSGIGLEAAGGGYHARVIATREGHYASGQHGECDAITGEPAWGNADRGHRVPTGWIYVQMRIYWIDDLDGDSDGHQYSPYALVPMRLKADGLTC